MVKKRKAPERKCVVTNETKPKKDLIRIVRNKEGEVFVDPLERKMVVAHTFRVIWMLF